MTYAEIDMVFGDQAGDEPDQTSRSTADRIERNTGVRVDILEEIGPGGGWPVVRVSGSEEQVRDALWNHWGLRGGEATEYIYQEEAS